MSNRKSVRSSRWGERLVAWIGAVGLAGLALALGIVLLPVCGITAGTSVLSGWLDACPAPLPAGPAAIAREAERADALRDRIAHLERQLAGLPACPPPRAAAPPPPQTAQIALPRTEPSRPEPEPQPPQPQPEPQPEPPQPDRQPPSEFDQRLKDQGGEVGEELTVTLIWDDTPDLDLEVTCPGGGTISPKGSVCGGGVLDVDANGYGSGGLRMMDRPVENILFGSSAPPGTYGIGVTIADNYAGSFGGDRRRNLGRHPFRIRVTSRKGERLFEGVHPGLGGPDVRFSFVH